MTSSRPPDAHPSTVLGAYLEPLVVGKRVVVLGDATIGLAEELALRGARVVHAYDPDARRVSEAVARSGSAAGAPSFAVLRTDIGVRDGAFDVAVLPELSELGDVGEALQRARRLVGAGIAVVVSPNPAATLRLVGDAPHGRPLGYYELYDAVKLHFSRVRMLGQAPFVGYTVADFASDGEPEVSVDTSLLERPEEPESFVVIASEKPVSIDLYAVVGLPFVGVVEALEDRDVDTVRGEGRLALAEAQTRLALVTSELETMRERVREQAVRENREAALAARLAELQAELEVRTGRDKELEVRAGDAHVRAERLSHQIRELEEELRRQRDRSVGLSKQLDEEKRGRQKAEIDLGMLRGRPEVPSGKERIDALNAELEAARVRIAHLELEFDRARTMPPAPEDPPTVPPPAPPPPDPRIALLEAENAKLDVELEAARLALAGETGRIDALERRLEATARDVSTVEDIDQLEATLAERGRVMRALERDLRETERVGRELLSDLEELASTRLEPAPQAPESGAAGGANEGAAEAQQSASIGAVEARRGPVEDSDLRHRLDTLAAGAARAEADLRAATWRISKLERELADATGGGRSADTVHTELEQALIAARAEVAALRRAMAETTASTG